MLNLPRHTNLGEKRKNIQIFFVEFRPSSYYQSNSDPAQHPERRPAMSRIGGDSTARHAEQQASLMRSYANAREVPIYRPHTYRAPHATAAPQHSAPEYQHNTRSTYQAHSALLSPHSAMGGRAASVAAEHELYRHENSWQEAR